MKYANNVLDLVGNTPLVKLNGASTQSDALILGKCEFLNPNGSVKDRIGKNMIDVAMREGVINAHSHIIEPTSGNTGIGLAAACAAHGLTLTLTMPESMSLERRNLLKALGANLVLTPAPKGMKGAIEQAKTLAEEIPNSFIPQQFENPNNPDIHRQTTALEILNDTDGKIDIFVAGVGTGGTMTGVGEVLKQHNRDIQLIGVEPKDSAVLSGESPSPHKIQGIGAGFVPKVLNVSLFTSIVKVSNEDAFSTSRNLAKTEGIMVGISSGANIFAATQIASLPENKGKTIVTILCDTGERYLSTELFSPKE
jgi:cysteine synthase A